MSEERGLDEERHASWAELFFDLVAVAGVAALAHVLIGHVTWQSVGLYALLFVAFWQAWAAFMLYGNVGGNAVRLVQVLIAMFGIGVMSSAIPETAHWILDGTHAEHTARGAHVFALAYVLTRLAATRAFGNRLVVDLPSIQRSVGTLPWLVSVFVDNLTVVIALWCLGVAMDLLSILAMSGKRVEEQIQHRFDQRAERAAQFHTGGPSQRQSERFRLQTVSVSGEHFGERLGLFVIIVLGECVVQVVNSASESALDTTTMLAGSVAFALLASIFVLALVVGHAGVPRIEPDDMAPRYLMLLHALSTATITALAVGLARVVVLGHEPAPDSIRWLLCGSIALYLGAALVASLATRRTSLAPALGWFAAGIAVPVLIGLFAAGASAILVVALLLIATFGTLVVSQLRERGVMRSAATE